MKAARSAWPCSSSQSAKIRRGPSSSGWATMSARKACSVLMGISRRRASAAEADAFAEALAQVGLPARAHFIGPQLEAGQGGQARRLQQGPHVLGAQVIVGQAQL